MINIFFGEFTGTGNIFIAVYSEADSFSVGCGSGSRCTGAFCICFRKFVCASKQSVTTGNFVQPRIVKFCKGKEKDYY